MSERPHGCCSTCGALTLLKGYSDVKSAAERLVPFICSNCGADARDLPFTPKDPEA